MPVRRWQFDEPIGLDPGTTNYDNARYRQRMIPTIQQSIISICTYSVLRTLVNRYRVACSFVLTSLLMAAGVGAEAATCVRGTVTILPSPLPSAAFHTFTNAQPGTKVYSYDIITVRNGKTSQDYLPSAGITCDSDGVYVSANGVRTSYPPGVSMVSHSLRTWALFPGLAPTGAEAAQIRLKRTRLVRTITAASAAEAFASPSPSPSPSPKPKHFL